METIFFDITIVIVAAAVLSWLSVLTRQPHIVAYILTGIILGPWGFKIVKEVGFIDSVAHFGITLLLFLAGLVLHPKRLLQLFKHTLLITIGSGLFFAGITFTFTFLWGFALFDGIITGIALMFSSTILVVKLMPTTTLHQKHMGFLCIAILIMQDLIAVLMLFFINGSRSGFTIRFLFLPLIGVGFIAAVLLIERFVIRFIIRMVDQYHELIYLTALAWCFGMSIVAEKIGLSHEIGAFIAGFALARSPVSLFISEGLKFFRDFFLVLFFFTLGANFNFFILQDILLPAIILSIILLVIKPAAYTLLFKISGENWSFSRQTGIRLGQASEFSLVVAIFSLRFALISQPASQMIQLAAIITMIVSSYLTVFLYPTPIATKEALKKD
jgi:glutathione-regulated potassium-efflux system ancillary protein KefC